MTEGNKVTYEERRKIYNEALLEFGADCQITKAVEEMSELTKELCKYMVGSGNLFHIVEELADVTIMCEQLRIIFDCNQDVCNEMDKKVKRLSLRIEERRV